MVISQDFVVKPEKHHLQLSNLVRTPSNKPAVLFHGIDDHIDGLTQLSFREEYLVNPISVIYPSQSPGFVSPNASRPSQSLKDGIIYSNKSVSKIALKSKRATGSCRGVSSKTQSILKPCLPAVSFPYYPDSQSVKQTWLGTMRNLY